MTKPDDPFALRPVGRGAVVAFDCHAAIMIVPASFGGGYYDGDGPPLSWLYVLAFLGDDGDYWAAPITAVPLAELLGHDVAAAVSVGEDCPFMAVCSLLPPDLSGCDYFAVASLPLALCLCDGLSDADRAKLERGRRGFHASGAAPISVTLQ